MLITYRKAIASDVSFMTSMLLESCITSGVFIEPDKLHEYPETEIYIKGWPKDKEFGVIAETQSGGRRIKLYIGVHIICKYIRNHP